MIDRAVAPFILLLLNACIGIVISSSVCAQAQAQPTSTANDPTLRSFHSANGLLNRGMHELASQEYRVFLDANPNHEKAPIARYGLGVALYRLKQFEPAIAEFTQLRSVKDFTYAAEVLLLLGQSYLETQKRNEATAAFEALLSAQPQHPAAHDAAALIVETLHRDGQYDKVQAACERLQKTWPESPLRDRAEYFHGLARVQLKDDRGAAEVFDALLKRSPGNEFAPQATLLLAQSQHRSGDLPNAVGTYRKVLEGGQPDLKADALFGLAAALQQEGKAEEALGAFDQFLKDHSQHALVPEARFQRGRLLFDRKEYEVAQQAFDQSAATQPSEMTFTRSDEAAYWAAKCELRRGRSNEAAARLAKAISTFPQSKLQPEMFYDCAVAMVQSDQKEAAAEPLRNLADRFPEHTLAADGLYLQTVLAHEQRAYESSYATSQTFLSKYPTHPSAAAVAFLAAENLFLAGKQAEAAPLFAAFLKQYPDHSQTPQAQFRLGAALHREGKLDPARTSLEIVAGGRNTAETFRPALLLLGDIAFQQERYADAVTLLGDFLSFGDTQPGADDALLKLGLSQVRSNQPIPAAEAFTALRQTHPQSDAAVQAAFERGQLRLAADDLDGAQGDFESVLAAGEKASKFAAYAMNHMGAIAMRRQQAPQAAEWFAKAAQASPEGAIAPEAMFQQGQALMAAKDYEPAQQVFATLMMRHADSPRVALAIAQRAFALARLNKHEEALQAIDAAERSHAAGLDAAVKARLIYEKAWCLRETGKEAEAVTAYRALVASHDEQPIAANARLELAEIEGNAKRFKEAAELLEPLNARIASGEVAPEVAERVAYRLAVSRFELQQYDQSAPQLETFIVAWPQSDMMPSARLLCGESWFKQEKPQPAASHFAAIVKDFPEHETAASATLRLAECQAALQQWSESEKTFQSYLERHRDSEVWFQAQFGLGWVLENQTRHDEAIVAYRKVIERHGGQTAARAQFQIGECLFAQKKHDDAVRELLKVDILYGYPEWSAAALFEAGRCFELLSRPEDARTQFEQVKQKYPDTQWANLALQRLTAMGAKSPGQEPTPTGG